MNQEHVADPAAVKTPENVPEFSRQLDTLDPDPSGNRIYKNHCP